MVMAARLNADTMTLLDPDASVWLSAQHEAIPLEPTLLVLQPSGYIQEKWAANTHGVTSEVRVAAAHNGKAICFRLEWDDDTDDSHPGDMANFPDQAGVMLPIKLDAPISEMGLPGQPDNGVPEQPVNMWVWRGDLDTPMYVTATGRGTSVRHPNSPLRGRAVRGDGVWQVVIARPFMVDLPANIVVPLAPGVVHKCTFAVWQGSNKERAGLKAYQPLWQRLEVER